MKQTKGVDMRTLRKCLNLFSVLCMTAGLVGLPRADLHSAQDIYDIYLIY